MGAGDDPKNWGLGRRFVVVCTAVLGCLTNAGLVFGYSALQPQLVEAGAFNDRCTSGEPCAAQYLALTSMFTIATSALNIGGLPTGIVLDRVGPRWNGAFMAFLVATGCVLFSFGGPGAWEYFYYVGFIFMAVAGPCIFVSSLSFPNLIPKRRGLITAAMVGCFDASCAIFLLLASIVASGISTLATAIRAYASIPFAIALAAWMSWPRWPVTQEPSTAEKEPQDNSSVECPSRRAEVVASMPFRRQIVTLEYICMVWSVSINMICVNYFIATVNDQLLVADAQNAVMLGRLFSTILPIGAIVYIPLIGAVTDKLGNAGIWVALWIAMLIFQILNVIYAYTGIHGFAYLSFIVFAFCRPLFYTIGARFTGQMFGFATFGTLYGLMNAIAGTANLAVDPLHVLAKTQNFYVANSLIFVGQVSTVCLPLLVWFRDKRAATDSVPRTLLQPLCKVSSQN